MYEPVDVTPNLLFLNWEDWSPKYSCTTDTPVSNVALQTDGPCVRTMRRSPLAALQQCSLDDEGCAKWHWEVSLPPGGEGGGGGS